MIHKSDSNWVHKSELPAFHYLVKCGKVIHYDHITFLWRGVTCPECATYQVKKDATRSNVLSENKQEIISAIKELSHISHDLEELADALESRGLRIGKNKKINKDSLYAFMYRNDILQFDTNADKKRKKLIETIKELQELRYTNAQMVLELNRLNLKTDKMRELNHKNLYNFMYRNNL